MKTFYYIIMVLIAVTVVGTLYQWLDSTQSSTRTETHVVGEESPQPEYCLRDTITGQSGEVLITEQEGGKYDYQIIATSHGIEVWVPCN